MSTRQRRAVSEWEESAREGLDGTALGAFLRQARGRGSRNRQSVEQWTNLVQQALHKIRKHGHPPSWLKMSFHYLDMQLWVRIRVNGVLLDPR